jgi:polar amino acid transport system substrate-binding protein
MKVSIAYIEEPPFGWTQEGVATGADLDLADVILRAAGVTEIEHRLTTFGELLPGVQRGRWDMNVPLFVTPQRMIDVDFSVPVWAIDDGLLVRAGNPRALDGYGSVARCADARLGVIVGQVQHQSAGSNGVREEQISLFATQSEAIDALLAGKIDAYASTLLGNRLLANRIGSSLVEAVSDNGVCAGGQRPPAGAFSFRKGNRALLEAVNQQLRLYLGSADHRQRMARFGLTKTEIDPALIA